MIYKVNEKLTVNIPEKEIEKYMADLDISREEAVDLWLDDNDYTVNEEQESLDTKAKKVKIQHGAGDGSRTRKQYVRQASEEKMKVFDKIWDCIENFSKEDENFR